MAILVGVKWYLIVVCVVFLITNNVLIGHLMSLEKYLFQFFAYF